MDLDVNHDMKANRASNNDVGKFTEELSKSLKESNLLIYNLPIDNGKFTYENLVKLVTLNQTQETKEKNIFEKIYDKFQELKEKFLELFK